MIRQDGPDTAGGAHAGICILHVDLPGQSDSITKPGQELLVRIRTVHPCAYRLAVAREAVEDGLSPLNGSRDKARSKFSCLVSRPVLADEFAI